MESSLSNPRLRVLISLALIGVLAIAFSTGCRSRAVLRQTRAASRLRASEPRVYVVSGRTLVMPVTVEGEITRAQTLPAKLDDGRSVISSVYWIGVAPEPVRASWLPPAGIWTATSADAGKRPAGGGTWAVMLDLPTDAMGQGVWFGGNRTALHWLPSPEHVKPKDGEIDWTSPLGPAADSPSLRRLAGVESHSPIRRWRLRLATSGLAPQAQPTGPFVDPVLEALASQMEARWQVALATLYTADPYVADRVKRRLVATVDFGGGNIAPAWPLDDSDLDALLADLLNTRLRPAQQVERATAWLDTQAPAAAWVMDDAGQRDGSTGQTLATIGVANLSDRDTLAWTTAEGGDRAPDLVPVPMWATAGVAACRAPASGTDLPSPRRSQAVSVDVHVGQWSIIRPTFLDSTPALPPGVRLEPLRREWDLKSWMAGAAPSAIEPEWIGGGVLYLDPSADNAWTVFLECRSPVIGSEEVVRLWVGPWNAPSAVINAASNGRVFDEIGSRRGEGSEVSGASVSRSGEVWTARIPIPARCIEPGGTLRLGIQRTDALGRRTSWPRPLLPWQTEPGRAAVDTKAWNGASRERADRR